MKRTHIVPVLTAVLFSGATMHVDARVTGFDILSSKVAYNGESFGDAGPYRHIIGIAHFAIDPASDRAAKVVDIERVPTNADGEVEFSTEVVILEPTGASNDTLLYDVANRGRNLSFMLLNLAQGTSGFSVEDPGDGFLMRGGFTMVWSGWQAGLDNEMLSMELPTIPDLEGPSREEFIFDDDEAVSTAHLSYPAVGEDMVQATLTVRALPGDPRTTPEDMSWHFIDESTIEITRPSGYDAGAIYELVYTATDAVPAGLGFIATSDLVSFLRGGSGHDVESPVTGIDHSMALGISQSGRFLKDFVYQGFNGDAQGERVFDGVMPHIAGSRKTFTNYRFAQPGRYSRAHEDHDFPGDQFPFSYVETRDPLTNTTDSILAACREDDTCPRVMHTDTSTEFWQARASLVSTSPSGEPLVLPEDVRLYFMAGAPHFNGWGKQPEDSAICRFDTNPLSVAPVMRALTVAMQKWVAEGTEPPQSRYPGLNGEGLVTPDKLALPLVGEPLAPRVNPLNVMDHSVVPPVAGAAYPVEVPEVDIDGNVLGGIRLPYVAVPTGTYFGWNLRDEGFAEGQPCNLNGSFIAFPDDSAEAMDDRTQLAQRYENIEAYREQLASTIDQLVEAGYMLESDRDTVLKQAPSLSQQ